MGLWKIDVDTDDDHGDVMMRCERYETDTILIIRKQDSPDGEVIAAYESRDGGDSWTSIGGSDSGTPLRGEGIMFRALYGAEKFAEE